MSNYTYENVSTGETVMVFPTLVIYGNEAYQYIDNSGELMTADYLQEHYRKIQACQFSPNKIALLFTQWGSLIYIGTERYHT